ncbi:hypothetical protein LY90DRAFT_519425 [Neocallimastix californiae]|uniref:SH3 domain-containing protein n=1 Tax=Neocallimastix californiae TaxID=1754190 RepID=A0A1Y1Z345_9FUNG|nr:hypothetical protein LY90DRAFT_519425 [Neocallimastix californiae]|eukprot:ORY04703.1 hypothetical protein LY90DRAFT_519425 [Neocallimastix californiae]
MLQKIIKKYNFGLCLTILGLTQYSYSQKKTTPPPGPVPTNGPVPTVQKIPDLSFLDDPYYSCFNMHESSVCEGYDFYIPNNGYYGDQFGTESDSSYIPNFDKYTNEDINENSSYLLALCPDANIKHNTQYVAYRNSVYCGRIMYSQARWCRENDDNMRANPQLSLCKSTCIEYANSIVDYSQNICKNTDNSVAEQIKKNVIEQWCNIFSDEAGCIKGVKTEIKNCGFLSATISKEAQSFNPNNSCWKIEGKMEEIQSQAKEESEKEIKMGAIHWKIVYPIGVIIIVSAITAFFWMKQNKIYQRGYIEPKSQSEYQIIPSNVEPSRDYVDEDYIKTILESPHATLTRNSSFAVRNRDNIRSSGKKDNVNVVYMIALYNYHPKMEDELELTAGDRVRVEHQYNDGWGAGINENTQKFGTFPLICCSENISLNDTTLPERKASTLRSRNNTIRSKGPSPLTDDDNEN